MNKITGAAMIVIASSGIGTASANDGVLFRNSVDPYFTTPLEALVLGEKMRQMKVDPVGQGQGNAPEPAASNADRAGVIRIDPVLRGNTP